MENKMYDGIDCLEGCDGFERTPLGCVYTEEGLWWSITEAEIVRLGEMLEAQDGSRDMGRGGYSEWCSLCGDEHRSKAAALRAVAGDLPAHVEALVGLLDSPKSMTVIYFDPATREPACIGIEARGEEVFREIKAATSAVNLPPANDVEIQVKTWMLQGVNIECAPNENDGWHDANADSPHFSRESAESDMADMLREMFREVGSEWYTFDVDDEDAVDEVVKGIICSLDMTEEVIEHDERGRCTTNPLVINVSATVPYELHTKGPE